MFRESFIEGMSRAACTVSVITTDGPAGRAGVTVSAMSSVSADSASPSLLVCVHHKSPACAAIQENGVFCVNVLREEQSRISDTFAGRFKTAEGDKFDCGQWQSLATGAPVLLDPLVAFDCQLREHLRWGSHYIFIGELADISVADPGSPLIYANRAYGMAMALPTVREDEPGLPAGASRVTEELRVGVFSTFAPYLLPRLLREFSEALPACGITLKEGAQSDIMASLEKDEIDIALTYDNDLSDKVAAEALGVVQPYVLLPAGHFLSASGAIKLKDLANLPMVLLDLEPSRTYFPSLFHDFGLEPLIALRSRSFETVRSLVGNGFGFSILATKPANNVTYDGRSLVVRPIADEVTGCAITLVRRQGAALGNAAATFGDICRQVFHTESESSAA